MHLYDVVGRDADEILVEGTMVDRAETEAVRHRRLAARLEAVQELAVRLNRTSSLIEIADVIIEGADRLIDHDSIRIYRVDHETGWCEPIGFEGSLLGQTRPDAAFLRTPIGHGLTGWAAAHNEAVLLGDASADPRSLPRFRTPTPESLLAVPVSFEDHVHGVIGLRRPRPEAPNPSLSLIVGAFKGRTTTEYTRGVNELEWEPFEGQLWQKSFYDEIIRSREHLENVRRYIAMNPKRWSEDEHFR